jgi:hypothetical protein
MISTAIFATISAALLMGFISLKRNYVATTDFATNHADQMRISDYLAMDFRRAINVDPPSTSDVTLYVPAYYDAWGNPQTPTLDGSGGVFYGVKGSSIKIHYYLSGSVIYRQEGTAAPVAIASDVADFVFNVTDLGKVVTTKITFNPTFRSGGASADARTATAFYNTTLLRNNRGVF